MQILQINASYKPAYIYGGPTMSVSKLSEELVKAGFDVQVFTTTANGDQELNYPINKAIMMDGVPVWFFKRRTKDHSHFSPTLLKHLARQISNSSEQQIIHIHAWWNFVSLFSCLIAISKGSNVILSPRGTLSDYSFNNRSSFIKKTFHFLIGKPLLKRCHFHVTSDKEKTDILNLLHPKSITVIPNFVKLPEISKYTQDSQLPTPTFKLLFLSRIEEKKGLDILFGSLAVLNCNWTLTIAGNGTKSYLNELKQLADKLNISKQVSWINHQNEEQKFSIMQQHDVLVLPSRDENFANVVIESLAMGTPVVISNKVGLADYVVEKGFGWVCADSPQELSKALDIAYQDITKRELIRKEAPERIRHDFADKHLIRLYTSLYAKLSTDA